MEDFKIRTYGWQELAILYAPDLTPESAAPIPEAAVTANPAAPEEEAAQRKPGAGAGRS